MTEDELLAEMDKRFGPGTGRRWRRGREKQLEEIYALGQRVGFGRLAQVGAEMTHQVPFDAIKRLLKDWLPYKGGYDCMDRSTKSRLSLNEFESIQVWLEAPDETPE